MLINTGHSLYSTAHKNNCLRIINITDAVKAGLKDRPNFVFPMRKRSLFPATEATCTRKLTT